MVNRVGTWILPLVVAILLAIVVSPNWMWYHAPQAVTPDFYWYHAPQAYFWHHAPQAITPDFLYHR